MWPIRLGKNIAKPNYHIGPRVTSYFSMHFVVEGQGMFIQDQQHFSLHPGDLFCLFPTKTVEYYTDHVQPLNMTWLAFDGKQSLPTLERIGLQPSSPHLSAGLKPDIADTLDSLFELARSGGAPHADFGRLSLFFRLFEQLCKHAALSGMSRPAGKTVDWLQKGRDYLEMHYAEGISVDKVAAYAGVERSHFSKTFQETYGLSPIAFIQQLKMNQAKQMMRDTDYSLTEIALSVGYPDLFSFSKAFKKHIGQSPTGYRSRESEAENVLGD
ncbi:AraC family transcriptional regulator [Paenibacillus piri]|uniref:AraC family transcriptional regulator n=2 Tax=Paenibacillus piri TaxID=2547395 RepID=A0A4R5KTV9_9BACL|nr:AraC family transcriptional regulator [Paenibacillus piri]